MWLFSSEPLAAQEPPGAWFLNAGGAAGDAVYFSVGGSAEVPPQESREVLLGWSWDEAGSATRRYPGTVPARYRWSRLSGKQPRQWVDQSHRAGVPALGIGPGRELLLLGDDEHSTARAMRWAEMFDSVEAAYRHSSPDLATSQRHGVIEVGSIGQCAIRSVPVDGDQAGWSALDLAGRARPSRDGGYYYVDPSASGGSAVKVRRFLRLLDGPEDCGGQGLDLSMIPAPRDEDFYPPYFLVWSDLALQPLDFLDLEPTPRTPAVRTLARHPGTAREEINIADWPAPGTRGIDLCQAPFMDTLCLKDLRIREQLATAATSDSDVAGPLMAGCRAFFDRLGSVPSPHPCSDPRAWRQSNGTYRTGYTGEILLREQPRLASRMNAAREVEWLWSDTRAPGRAAGFPLADGTRVALGMPRTAPPRRRSEVPSPPPSAPPTLPSGSTPPPSTAVIGPVPPPGTATDPRPAPDTTIEPVLPPEATTEPISSPGSTAEPIPTGTTIDPLPSPTVGPAPGTMTVPPSYTTTDPVLPAPETPADPVSPPETTRPLPEATTEPGTAPDSASPSEISVPPVAALSRGWLAPLALLALAMITVVALVRRGQRTSVRSRRQALSSGLLAEDTAPELLLDEDAQGERLLAGRDSTGALTRPDELLLEPTSDPAENVERPVDDVSPKSPPEPDPPAAPDALESNLPAAEATPPVVVLPLEPPELSAVPTESRWPQLRREWEALGTRERQEISQSLAAISRLGDWLSCLLPVLDEIEHGRGDLPARERLPPAAQQEWRDARRAIRDFAEVDLVAFHHLRQELVDSRSISAGHEAGAEAQYLSQAGLLEPPPGTLADSLRDHLFRPGHGCLHELVLALQYLIEAFPVEHLEKPERKAYLGAVRERLQEKALSTRFHQLIAELSSGLGLQYHQARFYKARIDDAGELFGDRHGTVDLSRRLGYPAGTDDQVVVRLSELFLVDTQSSAPYAGQALIDQGS